VIPDLHKSHFKHPTGQGDPLSETNRYPLLRQGARKLHKRAEDKERVFRVIVMERGTDPS